MRREENKMEKCKRFGDIYCPGKQMNTNLTFMEPCIARCEFYITKEMKLIQCSLLLSAL